MNVQEKVNKTWEHCIALYGRDRCIALTLHGSQNYECDLPDSDVDAKLFVAPTWDEVINYKQPLSKTIDGPYGDINVTDIRLFIGNNLPKQNFNFLECLFTPYSCVNDAYADLWSELIEHREEIAHIDPDAAVRTMMGQVENQYGRWGRFDKRKTLYHMMRISSAIETYKNGQPFADTLIPINHDHIMRVRTAEVCEEDMDYMFKLFYDHAHYLVENTEYKGPEYPGAEYHMNQLQARFVGRALYEKGIFE
jgi:hypothetical protein